MEISASDDITKVSRAKMAKIELHISNGNKFFKRRQFENALTEFKTARSLIYNLLYPKFDVFDFVLNRNDIALPMSADIEKNLINISANMVDAIRPHLSSQEPMLLVSDKPIHDSLKIFTTTGFRESEDIEQMLQSANLQAISLLNDRKVESAILLLKSAISQTEIRNLKVDPSMSAATHLNLAAANLQIDNDKVAIKEAEIALRQFKKAKDRVGQAQAMHLAAIGTLRVSNSQRSKQLFENAAKLLADNKIRRVEPRNNLTPTTFTFNRDLRISSKLTKLNISAAKFISRNSKDLQPIIDKDVQHITFRLPGRSEGWGKMKMIEPLVRKQQSKP